MLWQNSVTLLSFYFLRVIYDCMSLKSSQQSLFCQSDNCMSLNKMMTACNACQNDCMSTTSWKLALQIRWLHEFSVEIWLFVLSLRWLHELSTNTFKLALSSELLHNKQIKDCIVNQTIRVLKLSTSYSPSDDCIHTQITEESFHCQLNYCIISQLRDAPCIVVPRRLFIPALQ